jgi:hypothetical protein
MTMTTSIDRVTATPAALAFMASCGSATAR